MTSLFKCKTCGKEREAKHFSLHAECKSGYDTSRCKPCKKAKWDWQQVSYEKRMYNRAKTRAKKKGLEFNLELDDIVLPKKCPIFDIPFIYGDNDCTYSIDRIDPAKGYVKGNVQIISNRANMLKNNATVEELEMLLQFMKGD